jgi:O-antigen ligase
MACIVAYVFLKKKYVLCALAVVGGASLWAIGWFKPELFSWSNSLIEVFTVRYEIWQDTFKSFSQNLYTALIGRGPMSYFHVYETEGLGAHHHAHNIFLDTLINVGIVGFLMYAAIILLFVKRVFANRKRGDTAAFIVSALVIVEVIVQGIPDVTIMWHQTAPLFLIGCAATLKNN